MTMRDRSISDHVLGLYVEQGHNFCWLRSHRLLPSATSTPRVTRDSLGHAVAASCRLLDLFFDGYQPAQLLGRSCRETLWSSPQPQEERQDQVIKLEHPSFIPNHGHLSGPIRCSASTFTKRTIRLDNEMRAQGEKFIRLNLARSRWLSFSLGIRDSCTAPLSHPRSLCGELSSLRGDANCGT